jgi:hypothetical protein
LATNIQNVCTLREYLARALHARFHCGVLACIAEGVWRGIDDSHNHWPINTYGESARN